VQPVIPPLSNSIFGMQRLNREFSPDEIYSRLRNRRVVNYTSSGLSPHKKQFGGTPGGSSFHATDKIYINADPRAALTTRRTTNKKSDCILSHSRSVGFVELLGAEP
jgi:hypothetical protein